MGALTPEQVAGQIDLEVRLFRERLEREHRADEERMAAWREECARRDAAALRVAEQNAVEDARCASGRPIVGPVR